MFIIDIFVNLMCYGLGCLLQKTGKPRHVSSDEFTAGLVLGETTAEDRENDLCD